MYDSQATDSPLLEHDPALAVIAECDRKIANYRALLDAGTDPVLVASWIAETTAQRSTAEAQRHARRSPPRPKLTRDQIRTLISSIGDLRTAIRREDSGPAKAAVYQRLGIRLTYHPATNSVRAEATSGLST